MDQTANQHDASYCVAHSLGNLRKCWTYYLGQPILQDLFLKYFVLLSSDYRSKDITRPLCNAVNGDTHMAHPEAIQQKY